MKTYLVTTDNYIFELNITKYNTEYHIEYGDPNNRRGPCILLTYSKDSKIIKLNHIDYYKNCAKDKDLLRGTGTQEMLQTALKVVIKMFPDITRVILNDVSNFECNGDDILLSIYYILLYGETWYESKFKAKLTDINKRVSLDKFKLLLQEKPRKNIFSFYDSNIRCNTWYEYFNILKQKYGCSFMLDYKKEIESVANFRFIYSEWYIHKKFIVDYVFSIKSIKRINNNLSGGFIAKLRKSNLL